jgi:hypothetical protein
MDPSDDHDWIEFKDDDGQTYYYDNNTGMSQLGKPSDFPSSTVEDSTANNAVHNFIQKQFDKQRRSSIKVELNDEWTSHYNEDTQRTFYHNERTGVSQYAKPTNVSTVNNFVQEQFKKARRSSIKQEINEEWTSHFNPETKKTFYHNEKTGVSQYAHPKDNEAVVASKSYIQAEFAKKRRASVVETIDDKWEVHTDPNSGDVFYHNQKTGLSCWTIPDDASDKQREQMELAFEQAKFTHKRRSSVIETIDNGWEKHTDPTTQQTFYHNKRTGISSWEMPENESKNETKLEENVDSVVIHGVTYNSIAPPEMIPIGNAEMINNTTNHRKIVNSTTSKIVIIGSGFHKAMEFIPIIAGVTPDIKNEFTADGKEGKVVFATLKEVCDSVDLATSIKIRKDPLTTKEEEAKGNEELLESIAKEKEERLAKYKTNFKRWVTSLAPESIHTTSLTFIRNIYPMDQNGTIQPTKVKAAWVTGLNVDAALDCGSGKVALVDGRTGAQIGDNKKWPTNKEDARWTADDIKKYANMCGEICIGRATTVAFGTGNWRKDHMQSTVQPFKDAMAKHNIDFNLLPGELEAKYGGISSLKCTAPYDKTNDEWVIVELGGGSTQISRFRKVNNSGSGSGSSSGSSVESTGQWQQHTDPNTGDVFYHNAATGKSQWSYPVEIEDEKKEDQESNQKNKNGVQNFIQNQFEKQRRSSIKVELNNEWTSHFNEETQKTFYHNERTGVSQYAKPAEFVVEEGDEKEVQLDKEVEAEEDAVAIQQEFAIKRRTSISEPIDDEWTVHTDSATNSIFYHNEKTGLSTWTMPPTYTPRTTTTTPIPMDDKDDNNDGDNEDGEDEDYTQDYDTQEDHGDGEDNEDSEEDPEDDVPEDAFESLLTQQRSLMFESRQWKIHAQKMEKTCLRLQRKERGLLAELRHLEIAAASWRDRAISSEKSLLGFDVKVVPPNVAAIQADLHKALIYINELKAVRQHERNAATQVLKERDYYRAIVQQQQAKLLEQQEKLNQQKKTTDYRARRNWY